MLLMASFQLSERCQLAALDACVEVRVLQNFITAKLRKLASPSPRGMALNSDEALLLRAGGSQADLRSEKRVKNVVKQDVAPSSIMGGC